MEMNVNIDGRDVRFRATAALPLQYKAQFGRDLFADMAKVQKCWHGPTIILSAEEIESEQMTEEHAQALATGHFDDNLDLGLIYNIVWAMAKCADRSIKPPLEWYDQFEDGISIFEVFGEVSDILMRSMNGTVKN